MSKKQNLIIRLEAITEKANNYKGGLGGRGNGKFRQLHTGARVKHRGIEVFQHARLN